MKKTFLLAAMLIAVAVIASLVYAPDAFAAGAHLPASGHHVSWLADTLVQASPVLLTLRAQRDDLTARAAQKLAEIKDDLAPEAVRKLEDEHAELLRELERVKGELVIAERAESSGAPDPEAILRGERERVSTITDLGRRAAMSDDAIRAAVTNGATVEAFRGQLFDVLVERSARSRTNPIHIIQDESVALRAGMGAALFARLQDARGIRGEVPEQARQFMELTLAEMAARTIGYTGALRTFAQRDEVFRRALGSHSTSDFAAIFENALNKALQARYEVAAPTYRAIAQQRSFRDFRPHKIVRTGDFPQLQRVGQGGEIKFGTFGESKEEISVLAYAIQVAITRQMMIDDDLGAIDQVFSAYGESIAYFEEATFYAMLASNPTLMTDSVVVYHANHGNLAAAGTAITVAAVGAGRAAMRKQTGIDKKQKLNVAPVILLTGPDKETEADAFVASITPRNPSDVNPFSGKLRPVVSAEITGNEWHLFADPARVPNFQWGYLDGYTAPRVRMDTPFGVQGVGMSVEHDFGCGAIDFRGSYKNPGA